MCFGSHRGEVCLRRSSYLQGLHGWFYLARLLTSVYGVTTTYPEPFLCTIQTSFHHPKAIFTQSYATHMSSKTPQSTAISTSSHGTTRPNNIHTISQQTTFRKWSTTMPHLPESSIKMTRCSIKSTDLLFRGLEMIIPGGWCIGSSVNGSDPCSVTGNITLLRPTSGAKRVGNLISSLLSGWSFRPKQCK